MRTSSQFPEKLTPAAPKPTSDHDKKNKLSNELLLVQNNVNDSFSRACVVWAVSLPKESACSLVSALSTHLKF